MKSTATDYARTKRDKAMERLKASEDLAALDRAISRTKARHEAAVANDPTHTNDAKRKAALAERIADDTGINGANTARVEFAHAIAVLGIDIAYCDDMIKALTI